MFSREKKEKSEKWEYARYVYDWQRDMLELPNGKIKWGDMWEMFNALGEDGWEMVQALPLSQSGAGHEAGNTNKVLFIFKRFKI